MRNALVLVPLCIGLTCGFIVPTSTSEENYTTQSMATLKEEEILVTNEMLINNTINSVDMDLQLYNTKEDGTPQELYNEGSERNKTIEERSFILVNQRRNKHLHKSHLADTKISDSLVKNKKLEQASFLNVFREEPRENVVPEVGAIHTNMKYLNDRHEQHIERNKEGNRSHNATNHRFKNIINSNYVINSKHRTENKGTANENNFIELLKSSLVRPSSNIVNKGESVKNKYYNNKKHFLELHKENYIENYKSKKQNSTKQHKERYENIPVNRNRIQDLINESYVDVMTEKRLFHLLLEEPVPYKQTVYKHYNGTFNFKYCQKCARLAELSNIKINMECECRCGRYIHLKGRTDPKT